MKRLAVIAISLVACGGAEPPPKAAPTPDPPKPVPVDSGPQAPAVEAPTTTINEFFADGQPTFVRGTKGKAHDERRISAQIDLVRGLVFPEATVVADDDVADGWPAQPVVYGRGDHNAAVVGLGEELGLSVDVDRIRIGEQVLEGDDLRLVALVPATARHPRFVWYAGTGPAAVAEINAGIDTGHALVVADRFGTLATGRWMAKDGALVPVLGDKQRRIEYRWEGRALRGFGGGSSATMRFGFPAMVAEDPADAGRVEAALAGLERVVDKLRIADPVDVTVYIYPDRRSKQQLTGNGGDGHALPSSRTVHVLATDPAAMQALVAHEGTHVMGYYAVGPAATPLMGEGMAVWVSGSYGGVSIAQLRSEVRPIPIAQLLGPQWMRVAERDKYTLAATAFEVAVGAVGLPAVGEHLMGATSRGWAEACARAGTTDSDLATRYEQALR